MESHTLVHIKLTIIRHQSLSFFFVNYLFIYYYYYYYYYFYFKTSILTNEFRTPFISVDRGVLQGDCVSPLLFNLCFNTFLRHIKSEKYRQFGFSLKFLNPIHWFQFADHSAVISGQESENQHLINRFKIWCNWSNMIIRVEKCSTFGIRNCELNLSNITVGQ